MLTPTFKAFDISNLMPVMLASALNIINLGGSFVVPAIHASSFLALAFFIGGM
jgi:hypothetical protein